MKPARIKQRINFAPLRIKLFFGEQELATATAFHYHHKGYTFLVTNWHAVTGREPITHAIKSKTVAIPDRIKVGLPVIVASELKLEEGLGSTYGWREAMLPLYQDEEKLKPFWYEHPVHRDKVDAVAMRVGLKQDVRIESVVVNDPGLVKENLALYPGMDVFTLGYPLGITGGGRFPIWKRGSLATEPGIDVEELPKIYIDTATREGMSGSPVFASASSVWWPEGAAQTAENMQLGSALRFIGVYSGRIGRDPFYAQLGVVWKERALVEMIEGESFGQSSFAM
jgi:hypothetical protein